MAQLPPPALADPLIWDTRGRIHTALSRLSHPELFTLYHNVVAAFSAPGSESERFMVELLEHSATDGVTGEHLFSLFVSQLRQSPRPIRFVEKKTAFASISFPDAPPPNHWFAEKHPDRWQQIQFEVSLDLLHKIELYSGEGWMDGINRNGPYKEQAGPSYRHTLNA
uniref:Uncharacterized protein n=1 Tax=Mycena chlorophos TaxID=658473 RepID=A0ABQ0LWR2_MYCCL|nr:predicted protein [Mycena chlorophos]